MTVELKAKYPSSNNHTENYINNNPNKKSTLLNHQREEQRETTMHQIIVRTLQGNLLTFTVDAYTIEEGFVIFTDRKTGQAKKFHGSNCEIREAP